MVRDCCPATSVGRSTVNVLLIEDDLAEARFLQEVLRGVMQNRFHLIHVKRLSEAVAQFEAAQFDVILLDLTLPDSQGLDSLDTLMQHVPNLPIVVLTNTNDNELAVEAVRHGAQDYLMKRQVNQDLLARSLRYAIERKQTAEALREANEILEQRVQERTIELEQANEQLKNEIDRRQRIQERLELAQQAGKIGTFEWNIQSNQVIWTAELEALYCVAPGAFDGRYDDWIATIHADDRDRVEQELRNTVSLGSGLNTEFRIVCPNGDIRWIAAKSNIFYDPVHQPLWMIGVHIDITDKKQLEAQFLRAQRLESLGTLASGIAHDLNNILTPILAVTQILPLKLPHLEEQPQQMLKILEVSARRGAELVKQILAFTRGVEGKRTCLQPNYLLLEIEKIIRQTFPKSIQIQTYIAPNLWLLSGDETQLHQVLMNLCVNARDAMPQGGVLSITAENLLIDEAYAHLYIDATPGSYIMITVADTGCGIPESIMHRIFDPFFTTKEIGKGTGLGLSAVVGIVKSHSGFVDVHSEVDHGSQFKVFLPANPSFETPQIPDLAQLTGYQDLVLVIDDEIAICEAVNSALEAYGYRTLSAHNGSEAIALFQANQAEIHTVLVDLMMPTVDGLTVIAHLQRLNPKVQMIAMSGLYSTEVVAQVEKLGLQSFLSKPFTIEELLQVLQQNKSTQH